MHEVYNTISFSIATSSSSSIASIDSRERRSPPGIDIALVWGVVQLAKLAYILWKVGVGLVTPAPPIITIIVLIIF